MKLYIKLLITAFFLFIYSSLSGQGPAWSDPRSRAQMFPSDQFYYGYSMNILQRRKNPSEMMKELMKEASSLLSESIYTTINSKAQAGAYQTNGKLNKYFRHSTTLVSKLNIPNLEYKSEHNPDENMLYALAYVEIDDLKKLYLNELHSNFKKLETKFGIAQKQKIENRIKEAYKYYLECLPIIREIEKSHSVLIAIGAGSDQRLRITELNQLRYDVENALAELKTTSSRSLDDVCFFMSDALYQQKEHIDGPIEMLHFTYQDSPMSSQFSVRLMQGLKSEMIKNFQIIHKDWNSTKNTPKIILKGTYWREGDYIKLIANLYQTESGKILASAEEKLSKQWLSNHGIVWKPQRFKDADKRLQVFNHGISADQGVLLKTWTNHGHQNVVYETDDTLSIYIQVNRPSYIRVIYHQADGAQTLMFNNYYIDKAEVHKPVFLPMSFICQPPYGMETMQVNAQSEKFTPLRTRQIGNVTYVESSLKETLGKTRGMGVIKPKDYKAEKRIHFTTIEKTN